MDELRWILLAIAVLVIVAIYLFSRNRNRDQSTMPVESLDDVPSFSAKTADDSWVDGVGPVRVVSSISEVQDEIPDALQQTPPVNQGSKPAETDHTELNHAEPDHNDVIEPDNITSSETAANLDDTPQPLDPQEDEYHDEEVPTESVDAHDNQDAAIDDVIAVYVLAADDAPLIKGEKIYSACHALNLQFGEMKIFHRHSDDDEKKILFSMANIMEPGWFDIDDMHHLETRGVSFFMQVNLVENPSRVLDDMLICAHGVSTMLEAKLCNPHRQLLDEAYTNSLREKVKNLAQLKASHH